MQQINMDLTQPAVIDTQTLDWVASPAPGVERRMLEREAAESGRTTSVVRYAPGSHFPKHIHTGGEEFLVLEGVFSDEHGDYPAGTYVRNPPNTQHAPLTKTGCVIFVKLCQYQGGDDKRFAADSNNDNIWETAGNTGIRQCVLHRFGSEIVCLERWEANSRKVFAEHDGEEFFILEGSLASDESVYQAGTWARYPSSSRHTLSSPEGCLLYVKRGHLP